MTPTIPFGTAGFAGPSTFTYYDLLSDGDDIVSRPGTLKLAAGSQLRGAILKFDPATGNVTVPAVETDCNCILAISANATAADVPCLVYVGGKFKADAVIWPGALNHALITDALRKVDMQLESVVFTDGSLVKTVPTQAEAEGAKKVIEENLAAEKAEKKTAEEAAAAIPPRDSPWAYLSVEQMQKDPGLATIHDRKNEEAAAEKTAEGKKPDPNKQQDSGKPPQHDPHTPNKPGGKGGD